MNNTISGFPRLSGEFNRGYTKAIQDILDIFDYIQPDLRAHHKTISSKTAKEILRCCLINREKLRESINGFVRYNGQKNSFEFYEPKERR